MDSNIDAKAVFRTTKLASMVEIERDAMGHNGGILTVRYELF